MRSNTGLIILVIVVALMLFGVVSLGDVLGFIFYVFLGIVALVAIVALSFRMRLNRIRRQMAGQQTGSDYTGRNARRGTHEARPEGEVTLRQSSTSEKVVSNEVGSYVEYEEFTEESDCRLDD